MVISPLAIKAVTSQTCVKMKYSEKWATMNTINTQQMLPDQTGQLTDPLCVGYFPTPDSFEEPLTSLAEVLPLSDLPSSCCN